MTPITAASSSLPPMTSSLRGGRRSQSGRAADGRHSADPHLPPRLPRDLEICRGAQPQAADELVRRFDASLELLSNHPRAGPQRPELGLRLRSYPVGDYLIFYRPARGGVHVIRVIHGARNL